MKGLFMLIEMIPLNKLVSSPANVRRTGVNDGIGELAANIAALGLLQNLQVRAAAGNRFEVVAGSRRLAALKLLVKQKALTAKTPIACHVLGDEDAQEVSLAENMMRVPMHPADQEGRKPKADPVAKRNPGIPGPSACHEPFGT
jgi:ParB family chromosome partitioning protein